MKYKLTYARTVIIEREFEVEDEQDPDNVAIELEMNGKLGLLSNDSGLSIMDGSVVYNIVDDENVWEIKEAE